MVEMLVLDFMEQVSTKYKTKPDQLCSTISQPHSITKELAHVSILVESVLNKMIQDGRVPRISKY